MKKIAFLLPDFQEGGMPKVASNIMSGLNDDFSQYLILLDSQSEIRFEHNSEILKVCPKGGSKFQKAKVFLKRIKIVKEIKKKYKYDVVVSFGVAANIVNILSNYNEKTVITEHNIKSIENKTWGLFGKVYDILIKVFYSKSDRLVAISNVMKKDFVENYKIKKNIDVIYNPHKINEIIDRSNEPLNSGEQIFKNKITLINVGRLTYAKGHWHLIRVLAELKKEIPNIQLLFLGQGEMEADLKKLSEKLNIQDSVNFLGFQSNPYKFIKQSDAFVMSSLFEGFPNVLIESLACETPIISTDCKSGPREIIDKEKKIDKKIDQYEVHDYGIITPQFDEGVNLTNGELSEPEKQMKFAILELIRNKELYCSIKRNCRVKALEYDVQNKVIEYERIFN
ncbi:glycosyltransferase [Bacillus sp. ISL-57]|uniref:glycosyltransferase n=1 Tax=Bacillus sp. ISL-57 TaxID=2819135 RepID=UPI001BE931BD|nr:glycosyltransferase [Bacillus sp. ISL-57]MBT2718162.1 glycosyltransferase [Bacillus sp. ISL-57]